MLQNAKSVLYACLIIMLLLPSSTAKADVAPPPIPSLGSLEPFEYQQTNVQMVYERVEMELVEELTEEESGENTRSRIKVNAWFVLNNQGSQEEAMQVVFPLEDINQCSWIQRGVPSYTYLTFLPDSFSAWVDGEPVGISRIKTDHPHKNDQSWCEDQKMTWAAFDVRFPPGKDVVVRVQYTLDGGNSDSVFQVMYVLETGRGWKGPIKAGHIVFRFPYMVEDNVLPGTSPDFQPLYNEIYWSFKDLEPSEADNIVVVAISTETWKTISESRVRVQRNPADIEAWLQLAQSYTSIAHWHGANLRNDYFSQRAFYVLNQAIKKNPNSAELYAALAELTLDDCCYYTEPTPNDLNKILPLLQQALQRDPANEKALENLSRLQYFVPELTFSMLPTFPPSPTPTASITTSPTNSLTPTITTTINLTKQNRRTNTPTVVKATNKASSTPTIRPLQSQTPDTTSTPIHTTLNSSETAALPGQRDKSSSNGLNIGLFGAGIFIGVVIAGAFWRNGKAVKS
jgi:hypothetical protein